MNQPNTRADRIAVAMLNVLCILLPLALLVCFLYAVRPHRLQQADTALLYTVTLSPVRCEHVGGIRKNVTVLDAVGKREIGTVTDYDITPAYTQSYSKRAEKMRTVEYPGYVTVTLTVRADGKAARGGYLLGGFSLYRGRQIPLRLPNFVGTGICTALQATPISQP